MNRQQFMIAVMASQSNQTGFLPVHVQKVFFLLDREASNVTGGPHFSFEPYDYGPFDKEVYNELADLSSAGFVEIDHSRRPRRYSLTLKGYEAGKKYLQTFPPNAVNYITEVVNWASALSFEELVATIYKYYPDTKENSIFK